MEKTLKEWREGKRMAQADLAVRLGVHINSVGRWENGRMPAMSEMLAIIWMTRAVVTPNSWYQQEIKAARQGRSER